MSETVKAPIENKAVTMRLNFIEQCIQNVYSKNPHMNPLFAKAVIKQTTDSAFKEYIRNETAKIN